jgi:hypothetical protein
VTVMCANAVPAMASTATVVVLSSTAARRAARRARLSGPASKPLRKFAGWALGVLSIAAAPRIPRLDSQPGKPFFMDTAHYTSAQFLGRN